MMDEQKLVLMVVKLFNDVGSEVKLYNSKPPIQCKVG